MYTVGVFSLPIFLVNVPAHKKCWVSKLLTLQKWNRRVGLKFRLKCLCFLWHFALENSRYVVPLTSHELILELSEPTNAFYCKQPMTTLNPNTGEGNFTSLLYFSREQFWKFIDIKEWGKFRRAIINSFISCKDITVKDSE